MLFRVLTQHNVSSSCSCGVNRRELLQVPVVRKPGGVLRSCLLGELWTCVRDNGNLGLSAAVDILKNGLTVVILSQTGLPHLLDAFKGHHTSRTETCCGFLCCYITFEYMDTTGFLCIGTGWDYAPPHETPEWLSGFGNVS